MDAGYQINPEQERASRAVIGLPVLSIQEGLVLGYIKQILLDGQNLLVQAFIVDKRRMGKEDRLLPFAAVSGFGEDSVTVEKLSLLERKGLSPQYVRALRRPLPVLGARVFTDSGKTLGKVEEYRFSIEDGSISGLEVAGSGLFKGRSLLQGRYIIAISPQTIMVKDAAIATAVTVDNPFLSNMESAADLVKEKAAEIGSSAKEAGKKISANINDAVSRLRSREADEAAAEESAEPQCIPEAEKAGEQADAPQAQAEDAPQAPAEEKQPQAEDAPQPPAEEEPPTDPAQAEADREADAPQADADADERYGGA